MRCRPHGASLCALKPKIASVVFPPLSARFQSTSPLANSIVIEDPAHQKSAPSADEVWDASNSPYTSTSSTPLDHIEFPTSSTGIVQVEPHIGYLKELGLDFGWGPTAVMETFYEYVHVLSGTPWWGSILMTCALYRVLVLAAPQIMQSDMMARSQAMMTVMQPAQNKMREAMASGDQFALLAAQREMSMMKSAAGVKMWKTLFGPVVQGVLGFGTFRFMRSMAELPVPGLDVGGFLWVKDLTIPDPFFILPITLSTVMYFLIKVSRSRKAYSCRL